MKRKKILCTTLMILLLGGCGNAEGQYQTKQEKGYGELPKVEQEYQENEQEVSQENEQEVSQETNYLKQLKIIPLPAEKNADVDKSKYYAFVRADIELTKGISEQEYIEFCNDCVRGSGYKYFTVDFCNGTGIVFPACTPEAGIYGEIDETRSSIKAKEYIGINVDGTISLTEPTIGQY